MVTDQRERKITKERKDPRITPEKEGQYQWLGFGSGEDPFIRCSALRLRVEYLSPDRVSSPTLPTLSPIPRFPLPPCGDRSMMCIRTERLNGLPKVLYESDLPSAAREAMWASYPGRVKPMESPDQASVEP